MMGRQNMMVFLTYQWNIRRTWSAVGLFHKQRWATACHGEQSVVQFLKTIEANP